MADYWWPDDGNQAWTQENMIHSLASTSLSASVPRIPTMLLRLLFNRYCDCNTEPYFPYKPHDKRYRASGASKCVLPDLLSLWTLNFHLLCLRIQCSQSYSRIEKFIIYLSALLFTTPVFSDNVVTLTGRWQTTLMFLPFFVFTLYRALTWQKWELRLIIANVRRHTSLFLWMSKGLLR
jgi:hypothetical protein